MMYLSGLIGNEFNAVIYLSADFESQIFSTIRNAVALYLNEIRQSTLEYNRSLKILFQFIFQEFVKRRNVLYIIFWIFKRELVS